MSGSSMVRSSTMWEKDRLAISEDAGVVNLSDGVGQIGKVFRGDKKNEDNSGNLSDSIGQI